MSLQYPRTPNALLTLRTANSLNWSEDMNRNLSLIDALIGAYFVVQNLQGVWTNSTVYAVGMTVVDETTAVVYINGVAHTSSAIPTTFAEERLLYPSYWTVYSSPARNRGEWVGPGTSYALNDFVTEGARTAICIQTHVSTASFDDDVIDGKWSILVDFSAYGVMPDPAGKPSHFTISNGLGTDYELITTADARTLLGFTLAASSFIVLATVADMRAYLGVGAIGDFQPLDADLTAIALLTTQAYGRSLLEAASAAAGRTLLGLGTAAVVNTGVGNGNVPLMDATGYPAANGSQINDLDMSAAGSGTLVEARGGTGVTALPKHYSAYVTVAAGVATIVKSVGFTSVTRNAAGKFSCVLTTAMPDVNYRVQVTSVADSGAPVGNISSEDNVNPRSTTLFRIATYGDGVGLEDPVALNIDVFE